MATFTDKKNGTWEIDLTVATIRRIKSLAGVDLLQIGEGERPLFVRLVDDFELQGAVLWATIEPQARERGIEPEQFANLLGAKNANQAIKLFRKELADFFRDLERLADAEAVEGIEQAATKIQERGAARLQVKVQRTIEETMAKIDAEDADVVASTPGS